MPANKSDNSSFLDQFNKSEAEVKSWPAWMQQAAGVVPRPITGAPINMVLHCPKCHEQHIDGPEGQFYPGHTAEESVSVNRDHKLWDNPPHRSHLCHYCGWIWRPADVPTNGVLSIRTRGKNDSVASSTPDGS